MILLLVSGIVIPLYQHTGGAHTAAPVIIPVKNAKSNIPVNGGNLHETSFVMNAATKLLPVLKYF